MRKHKTYNEGYQLNEGTFNILRDHLTLSLFRTHSLIYFTLRAFVFFALSFFAATPAAAIQLTHARHLFDITHNFSQPSDIAVSAEGTIYVVDGVNNKIRAFNQKGEYLFSFGESGALKGQLNFPLGIDIDSYGTIYIADSGNHRVQIFSASGNYVSQIKIPSNGNKPSDPTDIITNRGINRLYVADNDNHCVLAYDLTTHKFIDKYGSPGAQKLEFRYPFLMSKDKNNHLYIVDVINTRVQELNPEGKFVSIIGGWGVEKGNFFRPKGIAVDKNNRIYVSDSYMGVIQVFRNNGEFHSAIGDSAGKAVKKFTTPTGIYIDNKNRLYVVEMFANKVSVFMLEEND